MAVLDKTPIAEGVAKVLRGRFGLENVDMHVLIWAANAAEAERVRGCCDVGRGRDN